jgi:hypothetical protein
MRIISSLTGLSLTILASACVDTSASTPCVDPSKVNSTTQASSSTGASAAASGSMIAGAAPKKCAGDAKDAPEGWIDDFEDGNNQLAMLAGRNGYWWTAQDSNGSTIEPQKFAVADGGASSPKAAHFKGTTSSENGAWGINFGVNFRSDKAPYDGSAYAGISFKAKVGPGSTKKLRFKIGDINTHQDAGLCKSCWNHFGQDITLTEQWQEYKVLFSETKQADGWGEPRPATITTDKLWNLDFSVGPGATYDVWVDDVRFLACP